MKSCGDCAKNTNSTTLFVNLMREVRLQIYTPNDSKTVTLKGNLSVGRTPQADLALDDAGLSRVHATFETQGEEIWLFDENSTNGTFVNGAAVSTNGVRLKDGDEIALGTGTQIYVKFHEIQKPKPTAQATPPVPPKPRQPREKTPPVLMYAIVSAVLIVGLTVGALVGIRVYENWRASQTEPNRKVPQSPDIPVEIIDPLKDAPENLDEIFSAWDVQDEIEAQNIDDVTAKSTETNGGDPPTKDEELLTATRATWEERKAKAMEARGAPTGITPPGLKVPPELSGTDRSIKQVIKLGQMIKEGYQQPMDFGDLAQKRLEKTLIELPMATNDFLLEVGSSATDGEFTLFAFPNGSEPLPASTTKFQNLKKLADNFAGQKYDMNNGRDRLQMKIRLLRMFDPAAKPILERLARAYNQKFNRPLRVTSLTRSVEYQIALNKTNANSYPCRGSGCLPPHTSGCAFDLARQHMTAEEQNFVMEELAKMERDGILDALIEYNKNACFHVFIYRDGKPPVR